MQLQPLSGKHLHFITNRKYNALRLFSKTRKKKSTYKFSIESADGGISVSQIKRADVNLYLLTMRVSTLTSPLSSFLQSSFFSVDDQGRPSHIPPQVCHSTQLSQSYGSWFVVFTNKLHLLPIHYFIPNCP